MTLYLRFCQRNCVTLRPKIINRKFTTIIMSDNKSIVGPKIKGMREFKHISLEEMSQRSGLSVEQISSIENDQYLPSLGPLIKIARALGVRLGTFLDDNNELGPVVCRAEKSTSGISFSNDSVEARQNMVYHSLARQKTGRMMEPFVIDVQPSKETHFKLSSHEGEEFIYVLEGQIEVDYGKDTYRLSEGDSIFYDSIVEHHVHGVAEKAARILAVVYIPF